MEEQDSAARRIWLEYISKLNDRAVSRQQASGFTTWGVAGVIAILLVKVIRYLPNVIVAPASGVFHLTVLTCVINLFIFGGALLILVLSVGTVTGEARLKSRMSRISAPIVSVALCGVCLGAGAANVGVWFAAPAYLEHWPFMVIGVLLIINALQVPAKRMWSWIKHREHFHDLPELSAPLFAVDTRYRWHFYPAAIIVGLCGLCLSLIPAIQSLPYVRSSKDAEALVWSLYVTGMVALLLFLCFRLAAYPYGFFLSQLERRIVLESLPPQAIRAEFIREYVGEDIRDWLAEAEGKLKQLYDEFDHAASRAEEQFVDLAKMDRGMQFEITGRKKVICETMTKSLHEYVSYADKLTEQMGHLADCYAPIACPDLFRAIMADWKRQIDTLKKRFGAVCNCCQKATSGAEQVDSCEQRMHAGGIENSVSANSEAIGSGEGKPV